MISKYNPMKYTDGLHMLLILFDFHNYYRDKYIQNCVTVCICMSKFIFRNPNQWNIILR